MLTRNPAQDIATPDGVVPGYDHDGSDGTVVLFTGPAQGRVSMRDGTAYDLTPDPIEVKFEHAGEVLCAQARVVAGSSRAKAIAGLPEDFTHECPLCTPDAPEV